jgi:hypothetical protein
MTPIRVVTGNLGSSKAKRGEVGTARTKGNRVPARKMILHFSPGDRVFLIIVSFGQLYFYFHA